MRCESDVTSEKLSRNVAFIASDLGEDTPPLKSSRTTKNYPHFVGG